MESEINYTQKKFVGVKNPFTPALHHLLLGIKMTKNQNQYSYSLWFPQVYAKPR